MLCLKTISKILSRQNLDGFSTFCFTHYSPIPTMGNLCTIVSSVSFAKATFAFVFFLIGSYKDKMTLEGQNGLQVFLHWSINDRRHLGVGWCSTRLSNFLLKPCRWMCGYFTFPVTAFLSCCGFALHHHHHHHPLPVLLFQEIIFSFLLKNSYIFFEDVQYTKLSS